VRANTCNTDMESQVNDVTTVELLWLEKRIENRIRFGRPISEKIVDGHRRVLAFTPGSIFAFVRWASNDFGTVLSRIDILRAAALGQRYSTVPWINPGGESLLRLSGWPKVERVLQLIDAVEALGSVMRAVSDGSISPSEGAALATLIDSCKKAIDMADVAKRLDALEARTNEGLMG